MRILIVNKFLYPNGGSETYIFKIGQQLQKMGHEVQYFGMEHENRIVGNRVESYTRNMNLKDMKLNKILYPFQIIYSSEARKKIRLVLDDFQPDVVHLNNFNFQLTPSILYEIRKYEKQTGRHVRILYTAHDSQLVCPNHLMQNPITGQRCTKCMEKMRGAVYRENVFMDQLCRAFWRLLNIRCTEISKPIEESIRLSVRASLCRSALRQILC